MSSKLLLRAPLGFSDIAMRKSKGWRDGNGMEWNGHQGRVGESLFIGGGL